MDIKENKKKRNLIILAVVVLVIVILYFVTSSSVNYHAPIQTLKESKIHVSKSTLRKLNANYETALIDKHLSDKKITYYQKTYTHEDHYYIGNFISDEDYVYQFHFDLDTAEVKLIEYSKNYGIIRYQVEASEKNLKDAG